VSGLDTAVAWVRAGYTLWLWRHDNGSLLIGPDETEDASIVLGPDDAAVLADLTEAAGHKDAGRLQRLLRYGESP
jgi:hypothetical protein